MRRSQSARRVERGRYVGDSLLYTVSMRMGYLQLQLPTANAVKDIIGKCGALVWRRDGG